MELRKLLRMTRNLIFLFLMFISEISGNDWSYKGKVGPKFWHQLFETCSGTKQSPINIISKETIYEPKLTDFAIWFNPPHPEDRMIVINNGYTVKVKTVGKFYVANGGLPGVYKTAQLHFHWGFQDDQGSEHQIDSTSYPMELHIVNYDHVKYSSLHQAMMEPFGLAVLGVMFKVTDEDNPVLKSIIDVLELIQQPGHPKIFIKAQSIRNFLPKDTSTFYRYNGSLTTPGCYETVIWTIFKDANYISHRQMKKLRGLVYNKEFGGHPHHQHHHHDHDKLIKMVEEEKAVLKVFSEKIPPTLESADNKKPADSDEEKRKPTEVPTLHIGVNVNNKEGLNIHEPHAEPNHKEPSSEIPSKIIKEELKPEEMVKREKEPDSIKKDMNVPKEEGDNTKSMEGIKEEQSPKEISKITISKTLQSATVQNEQLQQVADKTKEPIHGMQRDSSYVQDRLSEYDLLSQKQRKLSNHKKHHKHHQHHHISKRHVQEQEIPDENAATEEEKAKSETAKEEINYLAAGDKELAQIEEEIHKADQIYEEIKHKIKPHKIETINIINNYRPVQPLNDRIVLRSFPSFEDDRVLFADYEQLESMCSRAESLRNLNIEIFLTIILSLIGSLLRLA